LPLLSLSEYHTSECSFCTSINFFLAFHLPVVWTFHSSTNPGQEPRNSKSVSNADTLEEPEICTPVGDGLETRSLVVRDIVQASQGI
jgi:hypothetical protein